MSRSIDYGNLMHDAMRGLIRKVLQDVSDNGLPGAHHFFITFDTSHPDAELADWLSDRYPGEMTVVMQHWYDNLDVGEEGFAVTLNFGDAPEPLYIPYDAIRTFVDPSVEFGLRFETQQEDDEEETQGDEDTAAPAKLPATRRKDAKAEEPASEEDAEAGEAEIVSLDSFRK
ncbi:ClpXP protease specificity-enhancing factor SspB [uncultured Roseobacter sp.]|uniref:SspB family protein n=1 Tax=uncultured Roseobacter sp. TaxID=114847 RepID=UPI0026090E46|nr:ClpXP protease specificity-enhancing factor SspB [uncultured Roseobacter sp.]